MALILKPKLEQTPEGLISSDVYVDNDDGVPPLGLCCASAHETEDAARSKLRGELMRLLSAPDTRIAVDGIDVGQDVDAALRLVVIESPSASKLLAAKVVIPS
ncbi:MAG TPA: hypothetical protein VGI10_14825 [Polyangiaceae bacterium]|jgi:hypothetical protein